MKNNFIAFAIVLMMFLATSSINAQFRVFTGVSGVGKARIELHVKTAGEGNSGYQMLLDEDANTWWSQLWDSDPIKEDFYPLFEYKIPANADGNPATLNVVTKDNMSFVEVPAGKYDMCVANPVPGKSVRVVPGSSKFGSDVVFEAGKTYVYYVMPKGDGDNLIFMSNFDVAVTSVQLPQPSLDLSSAETICAEISNKGLNAVQKVELSYAINGATARVKETCEVEIKPGQSCLYTFKQKADFSETGTTYNVSVEAIVPDDGDTKNNTCVGATKKLHVMSLPFHESFATAESLSKNWVVLNRNNDKKTWEWANDKPSKNGEPGVARYSNSDIAADDYLISDPITLGAGDNYLSFYFRTYNDNSEYNEALEVYYGKDIDNLILLWGNDNIVSSAWKFGLADFKVAEAGQYRFFFRAKSDADKWKLYVDDVEVNAGQSPGLPDLSIERVLMPLSNCDISNTSHVGALLFNRGKKDITSFVLKVKHNDKPLVIQTFDRLIKPEEAVSVYFDSAFDFSTKGRHQITIQGICEGDDNTRNNSSTQTISNQDPKALPLITDFSQKEDQTNWQPLDRVSWTYQQGFCLAQAQDVPLISDCITMSAGSYSLAYYFVAGTVSPLTFERNPDDFYIAIGKAGTDYTQWHKIKEMKEILEPSSVLHELLFTIAETDQYQLAIVPTKLNRLGFTNINLRRLHDNDVRIYDFSSQIPSQTPLIQINGEWPCMLTFQNRGQQTANNVVAQLKNGEQVVGTTSPMVLITTQEKKIAVNAKITGIAQMGALTIRADVKMDAQDAIMTDNTAKFTVMVTDSVMALDSHKAIDGGLGSSTTKINFGSVFPIQTKAKISSVGVGLIEDEQFADDRFGLAIYSMDAEDNLIPLYSREDIVRGKGGAVKVIDIPDLEVNPGRIFVEVRQLNTNILGLATDGSPWGYVQRNVKGKLSKIDGFGYPVIRPYFGPQVNAVLKVESNENVYFYIDDVAREAKIYSPDAQILDISTCDTSGRLIASYGSVASLEYKVSLGGMPAGMYLLRVSTAMGTKTFKFCLRQ